MNNGNKDIAMELFDRIREAYPSLAMNLDPEPGEVELSFAIPAQEGLEFSIALNLQNNDELHLCAGELWVSWFPCEKESVSERFYVAVTGLLSGQNRIVEHWRGKRCVKAELQELKRGRWQVLATSSGSLPFPFPWKKTTNVLRNTQEAE